MKLSTISERQPSEAASLTRSLVQSLAYGATKFKNEILFHVGRLQRFADNPCDDVYKYALQILFEVKAVLVEHVVYDVLPQRSVEVNARVAPARATPGGVRVRHAGSRWPMVVCPQRRGGTPPA